MGSTACGRPGQKSPARPLASPSTGASLRQPAPIPAAHQSGQSLHQFEERGQELARPQPRPPPAEPASGYRHLRQWHLVERPAHAARHRGGGRRCVVACRNRHSAARGAEHRHRASQRLEPNMRISGSRARITAEIAAILRFMVWRDDAPPSSTDVEEMAEQYAGSSPSSPNKIASRAAGDHRAGPCRFRARIHAWRRSRVVKADAGRPALRSGRGRRRSGNQKLRERLENDRNPKAADKQRAPSA